MSGLAGAPAILVVEEEASSRNVIRDYLSRAHFNVRTAISGWEALKRLRESTISLVIAEHDSQTVDGSGLREKLLMNPETRETPFLFLVSRDKPDDQIQALRTGADDCIEKPFDPVVLVARVQAVIERRESYLRMVRVDPLTRLLNRPALAEEIKDELKRVVRYKRHGSIILIDLDHFAEVNKQHGYEMGDLLLSCLSGVILTKMRSVDYAGRISGQRFLLYLPETKTAGAGRLVERVQERLTLVGDGIAGLKVTFCAGIVGVPEHGTDLEGLMAKADETLKRAKESGPGSLLVLGENTTAAAAP